MKRLGFSVGLALVLGTTSALSQGVTVAPAATAASIIAPVQLEPGAEALRDALQGGGEEYAALDAVYAFHDYEPIWSPMKAEVLLAALRSAASHGLPVDRYAPAELATLTSDEESYHDREIALSKAFLTYARDVNSGLLEPRSVDRDIVVAPKRPNPEALLEGLAETRDPVGYLQALAPTHAHYTDLLGERARLEVLISQGGWGETVPDGPTLRPGDIDPRVVDLRTRISTMSGMDLGISEEYDDVLQEAVKALQLRHGLNDDAVIGPRTLAAINVQPDRRLQQVLVNLERQRWLNYERGARHIYVNQADFSVQVIDHGKTIYTSRVVIGKNKHRTQEFNDTMTHMVVNPTWHVPRSIATEEMLPKLKRNPGSLGRSMQIMTRNGTRVNPQLVDFSRFNKSNFPFIVKQRPGGGNALGRVKFMFPNEFNIYLHDTPAKSLFSRDARAYSHGCVRVQKPFELAEVLLAPQSETPKETFQGFLNSGREQYVNLEVPVPVYLTYQSAWIDEGGVPQYRDDIYGRDGRVFDALSAAGVLAATVEG
ncbi:MAG: L,D-transpeptidase family protein [Pseudomonadota bacterium]